ncbi:MAG: UbiA family prenyltransferase [Chloroflexota bacterium]
MVGRQTFSSLFALIHPGPSGATVLVAAGFACLFAGGIPPLDRVGWLVAMMTCQQVAISLHNDWSDRELDAVAKPWRAIPSGAAQPGVVQAAAWGLAALSILAALPLGPGLVALDAIAVAAGFTYNAWLKRTGWSWAPFAFAFPLLPLFGAAALGRWPALWWTLYVVGAPAVIAIHLADTLPDLGSDAAAGVFGLAHQLGRRRARQACLGALVVAALLGAGLGLALADAWPVAGAALGLGLAAVAAVWPGTQRIAVTAGAAAVALGWVAAVARLSRLNG